MLFYVVFLVIVVYNIKRCIGGNRSCVAAPKNCPAHRRGGIIRESEFPDSFIEKRRRVVRLVKNAGTPYPPPVPRRFPAINTIYPPPPPPIR
jgi:hypothetical protein